MIAGASFTKANVTYRMFKTLNRLDIASLDLNMKYNTINIWLYAKRWTIPYDG